MHLPRAFGFVLSLVVIGVAYLGYRYQMAALIWAAIALGGVLLAMTGTEPIVEGRVGGRNDTSSLRRYYGSGARLITWLYVTLAVGVIALGLFEVAAPTEFDRLWVQWLGRLPW